MVKLKKHLALMMVIALLSGVITSCKDGKKASNQNTNKPKTNHTADSSESKSTAVENQPVTGSDQSRDKVTESQFASGSVPSKETTAVIQDISGSDRNSILKMAEAYYKKTQPDIEADFKIDFLRFVPNTPDFTGKTIDEKLVSETSLQVGGSILSCNAKNYNLALSAAMVAKAPESFSAVMKFCSSDYVLF